MKRWYINHEGIKYVCSLLSLSAASKLIVVKSDSGSNIRFQFMKFYDFSKAKDGNQQTGWVKLPHTSEKVRAQIIFK